MPGCRSKSANSKSSWRLRNERASALLSLAKSVWPNPSGRGASRARVSSPTAASRPRRDQRDQRGTPAMLSGLWWSLDRSQGTRAIRCGYSPGGAGHYPLRDPQWSLRSVATAGTLAPPGGARRRRMPFLAPRTLGVVFPPASREGRHLALAGPTGGFRPRVSLRVASSASTCCSTCARRCFNNVPSACSGALSACNCAFSARSRAVSARSRAVSAGSSS